MTSTKFVIDASQMVHTSYCQAIGEKPHPYIASRILRDADDKPSLDVVHDYVQMAEHLSRPDQSGGLSHHSGPSMLKPCTLCIPSDQV